MPGESFSGWRAAVAACAVGWRSAWSVMITFPLHHIEGFTQFAFIECAAQLRATLF